MYILYAPYLRHCSSESNQILQTEYTYVVKLCKVNIFSIYQKIVKIMSICFNFWLAHLVRAISLTLLIGIRSNFAYRMHIFLKFIFCFSYSIHRNSIKLYRKEAYVVKLCNVKLFFICQISVKIVQIYVTFDLRTISPKLVIQSCDYIVRSTSSAVVQLQVIFYFVQKKMTPLYRFY